MDRLVLGLGLIGVVVAVAVLAVSLITGGFAGSAGPAQAGSTAEEVEPGDQSSVPAEDEAAAIAAVQAFNRSWLDADCNGYFAVTTENFRTLMELTDCESFYAYSRDYSTAISDFDTEVREVEPIGDAIAVSVTDSYMSPFDDGGNETAEPERYEDRWEHLVVDVDGTWMLDNWFLD